MICFPLCSSSYIHPSVKQCVESSFPHYGHSGIVEAARDLYTQIEGYSKDGKEIVIFVLVISTTAFTVIAIITVLRYILTRNIKEALHNSVVKFIDWLSSRCSKIFPDFN